MSGADVAKKVHGIGLGLKAVFGALLRAEDEHERRAAGSTAPGGRTIGPDAPTTRFCRKPQAKGWHCYELDGHGGECNLERDSEAGP